MLYSVIIPIYNEEANIQRLVQEVETVMELLGSWELIIVDDGSSDASFSLLKQLVPSKPFMRILRLSRNFGQSSAFAAGFAAALGEFIITLDGDLQNDPRDIPYLIEASREADLVVGWRIHRRDPWQKRIISRFSNFIRSRFCQDGIHDTGCSLKLYRREALAKIKLYKGMHRFLPALFQIEGFRVKEVPVRHRKRTAGKSKYHFFNRSLGPFIDMFVIRWMRKRALRHTLHEEISHKS